ncbi:hypothetical protein GAU_2700 [Gemmatimonas aurantiaca T-27]|uniref:Uncharacterized protein n=2 Tax=Gemmatimonas aurantiaca TaxID=173480 RepID=C1AAE4_GEMAT|nr:hypothetical protein GAU_2700 [Gemmatimonas aurantiaca T-27]
MPGLSQRMTRHLRVKASALAMAVWGTACDAPGELRQALPAAEFLFAAGDSTYWVRSGGEGMRVRSAPILLTQVDGRLFEIFIGDDGAEYPDASFATARLWARSLQARDSTLLFADSTVLRELTDWRRRHPQQTEIDPTDEDVVDDPQTVVQDDIEILDVHGPYLTFEHLLNVDIDGGPEHIHTGRRYVVDVRSGRVMSLGDLLGPKESAGVAARARASLTQLIDSIRTAGNGGDDRAAIAMETLDTFTFDSTSFGITDLAREPAVAFMVPGRGLDGEALALHLPAIGVSPPVWWKPVKTTLPEWSADSSIVRWDRSSYRIAARPSPDGDALALVLSSRSGVGGQHEWPVATVGAPAYQLIALESPPLDSASRAALARAFDVSTALDGMVQRARYRGTAPRSVPEAPSRWRLTSHRVTSNPVAP